MFDRPLLRRILWGVAANGFSRATRIGEQLLLIPLLLAAWGVDRYGEWITLTSLALFASIANLGIGHAAQSDIVLRYASGDAQGAARSGFTAIVLLTAVVATAFACVFAATHFVPVGDLVSLRVIKAEDARSVIVLVSLAALVTFYTDPLAGAIAAVVGIATPNLLFGIAKATEVIVIAIALQWSAGPMGIAAIMLAAAVLNVAMHVTLALRYAPWLSFRPRHFDVGLLRLMWRSSLGFFLVFVGINVFNVQVPRLIVYHYFGAATLVAFTVLVTYTKTARSLVSMISQAAQIEIGRAFAGADLERTSALVGRVLVIASVIGLLLLAGALVLAPFVIPYWSHGTVPVSWGTLTTLALVALVGTYFDAALLAAGALNRVFFAAAGYWAGLIVGTALALLVLPWMGLLAITAIALLLPDLVGSFAATLGLDAILHPKRRLMELRSFGRLFRFSR